LRGAAGAELVGAATVIDQAQANAAPARAIAVVRRRRAQQSQHDELRDDDGTRVRGEGQAETSDGMPLGPVA